MKYAILVGTSAENLVDQVNEHIAQGWSPIGGVAVSVSVGSTWAPQAQGYFCQAMTFDQSSRSE